MDRERQEQERLEQERLQELRLEQERLEQERLEKERREYQRLEQKRLEQEHLRKEERAKLEVPEDDEKVADKFRRSGEAKEPVLEPLLDQAVQEEEKVVSYDEDFADFQNSEEELKEVRESVLKPLLYLAVEEEENIVSYDDDFADNEGEKEEKEEELTPPESREDKAPSPIVIPSNSVTIKDSTADAVPFQSAPTEINPSDVNRRIRVHWDEGEFYDGVVDNHNSDNGHAHIKYDDGDEEWLNPADGGTNWEWIDGEEGEELARVRRKSSYDVVSVDRYAWEGMEYLLDHDTGKLYDLDTKFVGKLVDEKPNFEAVDSEEESEEDA